MIEDYDVFMEECKKFFRIRFFSISDKKLNSNKLKNEIKGVKKIVKERFRNEVAGKEESLSLSYKEISEFNTKNQLIKETIFFGNTLAQIISYKYDRSNRLNKQTSNLGFQISIEYEKNYEELVIKYYENNEINYVRKITKTDTIEIEENLNCIDGDVDKKIKFFDNNRIIRNQYFENGELTCEEEIEYQDDKNTEIRKTRHFGSMLSFENLISVTVYDSFGNILEKQEYDLETNKLLFKTVSVYNTFHNLIESCKYDNLGELVFKVTYQYDSNGNLINKNEINRNSSNYQFKYTYDKEGNCIQEIEYINGMRESIIGRKITYN